MKYVPVRFAKAKTFEFPIGNYATIRINEQLLQYKVEEGAIDVVFCKDCRHNDNGRCLLMQKYVYTNDFCSRGEER